VIAMEIKAMDNDDALIDERALSKLKWRCRRGLLENDIFIERFFQRFESTLTVKQAQGMGVLMELSDNDLLDLHLARKSLAQVDAALDRADVSEVLSMLRETVERSK
jgi:antitoxin CptB